MPSDMTGRLGTPMKETVGLSKPPRSLNHQPMEVPNVSSPRVEHRGLPEACQGRGPRANGPCHKVRDSGPNEACQSRARGPGGREHGEDAHFPRTRSVARSVHDRVARRYLVESSSGVHASTSKEGVTGHFGTPMKETGGLSQPLRSLNRPNKTKQNNIEPGRWPGQCKIG